MVLPHIKSVKGVTIVDFKKDMSMGAKMFESFSQNFTTISYACVV